MITPFVQFSYDGNVFFYFSFTAEQNQTVTNTVIDAVLADYGGDKCPWSAAELRGTLMVTHGFIIAALGQYLTVSNLLCK